MDRMARRFALLFVFLFSILAGVPAWWYLRYVPRHIDTEVFAEIASSSSIHFCEKPLTIQIVNWAGDERGDDISTFLQQHLNSTCTRVYMLPLTPEPSIDFPSLDDKEIDIILGKSLGTAGDGHALTFFLLCPGHHSASGLRMGASRHGWLWASDVSAALADAGKWVQAHVLDTLPRAAAALDAFDPAEHLLKFALVHADVHSARADWDFAELSRPLAPFLRRMRPVTLFRTESAVLYHAPSKQRPERAEHGATLPPRLLSSFVNRNAWDLGPPGNDMRLMHRFIAYVPSREHAPLRIVDEHGVALPTNGFEVPRWGGVVVLDTPHDATAHSIAGPSGAELLATFHTQLRSHLGLAPAGAPGALPARDGLASWELDLLIRARAAQAARDALELLQHFATSAAELTSVPIPRALMARVAESFHLVEAARKAYKAGDLLEASATAREALCGAKEVAFHEALLPQLYFPVQHTFAVYSPLLLPISVSTAFALLAEVTLCIRTRARRPKTKQL